MDVSARSQDTFGGRYHERIAHSKTTHDHALRRGTYRSKRRRGGGAFSGWRLALPSGLFAIIIATGALLLIGAGAALAFFAGDLPSPRTSRRIPLRNPRRSTTAPAPSSSTSSRKRTVRS